jgi:hypothetical protein
VTSTEIGLVEAPVNQCLLHLRWCVAIGELLKMGVCLNIALPLKLSAKAGSLVAASASASVSAVDD